MVNIAVFFINSSNTHAFKSACCVYLTLNRNVKQCWRTMQFGEENESQSGTNSLFGCALKEAADEWLK